MPSDRFARTPEPPYFAVGFTCQRAEGLDAEYAETAARMADLRGPGRIQGPGSAGWVADADADADADVEARWRELER